MPWDGTPNGPPDWMRHVGTHRPLAVEARLTNNVPEGKSHHFIIFINIYYGQILFFRKFVCVNIIFIYFYKKILCLFFRARQKLACLPTTGNL